MISTDHNLASSNPGLGVKCVIARSFSFIYGRNQPSIGLLGIIITDDRFYSLAHNRANIEINLPGRFVRVYGETFTFVLDEMELALTKNQGLAAAYKKFGSRVFQSLCGEEVARDRYDQADIQLTGETTRSSKSLAW